MKRLLFAAMVSTFAFASFGCDEDGGGSNGSILIETLELANGRVLMEYSETLLVSQAKGDVAWSISAGELPPGLEMSSDGVISGIPEFSGIYSFSVQAEDNRDFDDIDLEIVVPKILLMSGFEPFGGYDSNPSYDAIVELDEEMIGGFDVRTIEIPVTWAAGWTNLRAEIEHLNADIVVATGVAGSDFMRIETNGQNIMEQTDNDGVTMNGEEIVNGGPADIGDGLPAQEIADAMNAAGYSAQISDDAGTYLCNHVLYNLMYYAENEADYDIIAGFIHVPPVPTNNFDLEDITSAHLVGIEALGEWYMSGSEAADAMATVHSAPEYL